MTNFFYLSDLSGDKLIINNNNNDKDNSDGILKTSSLLTFVIFTKNTCSLCSILNDSIFENSNLNIT